MTTVCVIFGLLIGSFLTVCIHRVPMGCDKDDADGAPQPAPQTGMSIISPARSVCPKCGRQLSWHHNIPVVSWIILRGRCAFCSQPISARYPAVVLLSALLALLSYQAYGLTATAALVFAFSCTLLVITFIDYDHYIIPNVITYPGTALGLGVGLLNQSLHCFRTPVTADIWDSLLGILLGAGFLAVIAEAYLKIRKIEGLGWGDVKLLAMTGALFGWQCSFYTIFLGSLIGAVVGMALVLCAGRKMSQMLPFGPFLALASLLYLFVLQPSGAWPIMGVYP